MNSAFDRVWNKGFKRGEIGWTNFNQDFFKSVTCKDILGIMKDITGYQSLYKITDGGGVISFPAYRQFRIRRSSWSKEEETQYRHDIEYERLDKNGATEEELEKFNQKNPGVRSAYTPIKPIVAGNRANDQNYNQVVLDKFALYPLSYRVLKELNRGKDSDALLLYNKMQKGDVDYMVYDSSRKVGAVDSQELYNKNGEFNPTPFSKESIINIPFHIMSEQTEVPSKDDDSVSRGSQITKLATMDFMEVGVPIDFIGKSKDIGERYKEWQALVQKGDEKKLYEVSPLYREIKNNQNLLEQLTEAGYQNLLKRLGIREEKGKYIVDNFAVAYTTLREEILKIEVNENISDALSSFMEGSSILEATPAYRQVRDILYSIADKEITSQKINGGMKVLIPAVTLINNGIKKVEINGKTGYTSDALNWYVNADGKRVCEIMIGRWFDSKKTDEELLNEWYNKDGSLTEEGKKILSGIGFRIPTQGQNSIESFVIKKFLPREFGDSIVLPDAMVQKTGGDFDIDKLTTYLKNVFEDVDGRIKLVESKNSEQATKSFYDKLFSDKIWSKIDSLENKDDFRDMLLSVTSQIDNHAEVSVISPKTYLSREEYIIDQASEREMKGSELIQEQLDRSGEKKSALFLKLLNETLREGYVDKMYRKALQNDYIQSLQNLVSHPLNFNRLVSPNSADQLKELATEVVDKKIKEGTLTQRFNYTEVGNMLDRVFMSQLRHAFLSGKQAIAIAAVGQTNHAQNQRSFIYIDPSKLKDVSDEDRKWLGNALITFDKYNKVNNVTSLSMVKNAEGQDISNIISQFIDGYVDISKGPWIMELGATPSTTSTWLFLTKIGVPIDTISYFMNQPIIQDYLHSVENAGYSWLFMDSFVDTMKSAYSSNGETTYSTKAIPSKENLRETMGRESSKLNDSQKDQQRFMLDEFLKYSKMASHLFNVVQGTNFDTANLNDPYLITKKLYQLDKAKNTIIGGVEEILNNSFVGVLGKTQIKMRDALSNFLKSDQSRVRGIITQVLKPYMDLPDKEFTKVAQKAVSDLFDYAVQTNLGLNKFVQNILIKDGGVGMEILNLMNKIAKDPSHPLYDNYILGREGIMKPIISSRENGVNNAKVKGLGNKAYDQNSIIYSLREVRNELQGKSDLYDRIVALAVLQSGLSSSNISFTSVLPFEDFKKVYNETLLNLENIKDLDNFAKLNVFERNNWDNDDLIPHTKAKLIFSKKDGTPYYNPPMEFLNDKVKLSIKNNEIPQVMTVRQAERDANSDHIVYSWEKSEELIIPELIKKYPNLSGDYSYINKGLFEKVRNEEGNPLETSYIQDSKEVMQYVYKAINAWGDGRRANEFYTTERPSVIDNGFIKVIGIDNQKIIDLFPSLKEKVPIEKNAPEGLPEINTSKKINIYAGTNENAELSNFANRPFKWGSTTYPTVEHAFQIAKLLYTKSYITEQKAELTKKMLNMSAAGVKSFARTITGLDVEQWDKWSTSIMKDIIKDSFSQNTNALQKLLATGNSLLTHTQDNTKWKTEFPRILMEVRNELSQSEINSVLNQKEEESKPCNK
jgi:predicted NAD-dependent protein-ADP-ribosyltransferase YbiA (DUF1768 family)